MLIRNLAMVAVFLVVSSTALHADTFYLDDVTFSSGATETGTLSIDTTTGVVTDSDLTYTLGGQVATFSGVTDQSGIPSLGLYVVQSINSSGNMVFNLVGDSLVGYTGGLICSLANLCDGSDRSAFFGTSPLPTDDYFATGSLTETPPSSTPEPDSLVFVGTGLLGVIGEFRRRRLASRT
jgi:hypothetical protein